MKRRGGPLRLDMALAPVPEFQRDDKLAAVRAELAMLRPYIGQPARLRSRVDDLQRREHELLGLPFENLPAHLKGKRQ